MSAETYEKKMADILESIEDTMLERAVQAQFVDVFPKSALRSSLMIFNTVLMSEMWTVMQEDDMPLDDRIKMVEKAGADMKKLVHTYTNIDTFKLYDK